MILSDEQLAVLDPAQMDSSCICDDANTWDNEELEDEDRQYREILFAIGDRVHILKDYTSSL